MRALGIDVGSVRIGIALSDAMGIIASPHGTIAAEGWGPDAKRIAEVVETTGAEVVVVGMPRNLKGEHGPAAESVQGFIERLTEHLDVPVKTWDERLTTVVAERSLLEAGKSRNSRKNLRDKVAAAVILQGYLDAQTR